MTSIPTEILSTEKSKDGSVKHLEKDNSGLVRHLPDAPFLFEFRVDKVHFGSIIILANIWQYYHIMFLDRRHHWHLVGVINRDGYIRDKVTNEGFHVVPRKLHLKKRKPFFILILDNKYDHFLPEVTVVNHIHKHPFALKIMKEIPFQQFADEMMVNSYDKMKGDGRANNRIDVAYTPLNQRDPTVLSGQHVPTMTKAPRSVGEFISGENPTTTIIASGCLVREMSDYFCVGSGQNCFFTDQKRYEIFGRKTEKDFGLPEGTCYHEGTSVHQCGVDKYYQHVFTRRHIDRGNQSIKDEVFGNYEANVGLSRWVEVDYGLGHKEILRCGLNIYGKACCRDPMSRREKVMKFVTGRIKPWLANNSERMGLYLNDLDFSASEFVFIPPKANKKNFYSIFIHVILTEVGPACGWNRAVILEAIYAITFITCPKTWVIGIRYAVGKLSSSRNMFLFNFIEGALIICGSTGGGEGRRRQPSRNKATLHTTIRSLMNLEEAIDLANFRDIGPKRLLEIMSGDWYKGGLFGARKLIAMEIMCIATMSGLIRDEKYAKYAEISETHTRRRLKAYGIVTQAELADLVRIVANKFCNGCCITAENLICEVLREDNGQHDRIAFDTMMKGQGIYDLIEGHLARCKIGQKGGWEFVSRNRMKHNSKYNPYFKWWEQGDDILAGDDVDIAINWS